MTAEAKADAAAAVAPSSSPLLSTTLSLVLLQLVSRLFSFSMNQVLLRSTTPQALGVATMGFEVVRDTGLFLLREGLRGAVVRSRSSATTTSARLQRTLSLPLYLTPLLPPIFALYSLSARHPLPPGYHLTLLLYCLSAVLELLSERYYLHTLLHWEDLTSTRVRIEGAAMGVKSLATLGAVFLSVGGGGEKTALLSFGVGQMGYAATLLIGLWWSVGRRILSAPPLAPKGEKMTEREGRFDFDPAVLSTSWALTKQSLVKQFLTEGDKILVGRLSAVEDQGGYAVALNYGSLVARILFQPLEETSRLYFSSLTASPFPSSLLSTAQLLSTLLTLHTHLSLIFILLAPPYTSALLYHLLGPRWSAPASSAPVILRAYCAYLPFLALNGVTEAFFASTADPVWLRRGSYWLVVCSAAFLCAVYVGVRQGWGERGLIWANCLNMAMRMGFSAVFIRRFYQAKGAEKEVWEQLSWRRWMPKGKTVLAFALSGWVVRWSEEKGHWRTLRGMGRHVGVGAVCGVVCLGVTAWAEKRTIKRLLEARRHKTD